MKYLLQLVLAVCMFGSVYAADQPLAFDKFYKPGMKVTPGVFPVYQDGDKYYLEIPAKAMDKDILVMGDVAQGFSNMLAPSSGVIRFSTGDSSHLNVIRQEYKEAVSHAFNQDIEPLVQLSNLVPVSFVVGITALGKDSGSYIIDISHHLKEGGSFLSFKDFAALSRPDPERSGVRWVRASKDAVTFGVLRTQTDPAQQGGAKMEIANAFVLHLTFQLLGEHRMQGREADARIGFKTVSFNDFGKNPYGVRSLKLIHKWNLQVAAADSLAYSRGELVTPVSPITVYIDRTMPSIFVPYVEKAIGQWDRMFAAAGFTHVFKISRAEEDDGLLYGKLLIKWGSAYEQPERATVEDPRSGEILAAKLTVSEKLLDPLLDWYFVACGLQDERIIRDFENGQVKGELMEWVVANSMGELLGMVPNYCGSGAYTTAQLRSAAFVGTHGITASVTDGVPFNFVSFPGERLPVHSLIAHTGSYDSLAIGWAYRAFATEQAAHRSLKNIPYADPALRYLPSSNNDPYTQRLDLASDIVAASGWGMKGIESIYPRLDSITGHMPDPDEDWELFKNLAGSMSKTYDGYVKNVLWLIGGHSGRPVFKGYNEVPEVFVSKKEQQAALVFLDQYIFKGAPVWMKNKRAISMGGEPVEDKFERMADAAIARLLNPEVLDGLVSAEIAQGREAFTAADLFAFLDKTCFLNFSATAVPTVVQVGLQRSLVSQLTQAINKNAVFTGLDGVNEVLHVYFVKVLKNIDRLGKTHVDARTRVRYQLFKAGIEKEFLKKPLQ